MDLLRLREEWLGGHAVEVGREIFTALDSREQVARAACVLDVCRRFWRPVRQIDAVAALANHRTRWNEGHSAFDAVRDLTLREEAAPTSEVYCALLFVAENTAKTIYNASGPPDPFDEDSPWWLASNVLHFAKATRDAELADALWCALTGTSVAALAARPLDELSNSGF
jgi:hypothetical protein